MEKISTADEKIKELQEDIKKRFNMAMEIGFIIGRRGGINFVTRNLIMRGMSDVEISEVTHLSIEQIENLKLYDGKQSSEN